ncbi:MAG: NAD-dependent epimerase/dehydratase family protein [Bryobacterales bacterium]|nr:NAD-dependent epimerase/dehydratase family protein [Bryobacterales bacterium]
MRPILVTGASGFIGWHVARALQSAGRAVRALIRPTSKLRDLEVETAIGDLRDPASLAKAVAGCEAVYHVAADYRLWAKNPSELFAANVEGTRNLLEAARSAAVDRVVYTSTVGCISVPEGGLGTEALQPSLEHMVGAYKRSKFLAERAALEIAQQGFPVVIVNPTAPIGDHDVKPTPTGRIVLDFITGRMPAFIDTGLNLVDVRDVANGHLLACEHGRPGERYILGAENLTLERILSRLASITGKPSPKVKLPWAVAWMAGVATTAWARVAGGEPRAPLDAVRMAKKKMFVSHEKARLELGFEPGAVDAALARAVDWFRANGYC